MWGGSDGSRDVSEQTRQPGGGLLAGGNDLGVVQRGVGDTSSVIGDQGQAEQVESGFPGGDGLKCGRHADEVGADGASHAYLGRSLVLGAAELGVDAGRGAWGDLLDDLEQCRGPCPRHVDESGATQRGGTCEVDVVANGDDGSRAPGRVEASAAIGEDHRAGAKSRGGAHSMDNRFDSTSLVEVGASGQNDGGPAGGQLDSNQVAAMPGNYRCRESRQFAERDSSNHLAKAINSGGPARAEHESHIDAGEREAGTDGIGSIAGDGLGIGEIRCRHGVNPRGFRRSGRANPRPIRSRLPSPEEQRRYVCWSNLIVGVSNFSRCQQKSRHG